ncbi:relaxase/mobilization nuclease domain-containing protein [Lysobacter firmicutimachus]|uniref:Relaxase/mobilization nuclease domain-containing protein n=1 Tax=Lysobacter firmicutimachus TaxID=1792846 RepID=A0AAU8MY28_9GAMM
MNQPLDSLQRLLRSPVRWRKGLPDLGGNRRKSPLAEDLQTIVRVTARTPEVMVRISGKAKGAKHVEEHLRYITRNGDLTAEDESGQLIIGRRMVKEAAAAWMEGSALNRRSNSRDTVNIVLSMPPGTDRDKLLEAARQFGHETFGNGYSYLLVRHDDTDHPHCHLTVRSLGFTGQRLNPKRDDLQAWRAAFAAACRQHGIAAEATPRRTRGVIRKPKKQAVLHADKAKRSSVQREKVREALMAITRSNGAPNKFDQSAVDMQLQIRHDWKQLADHLARTAAESGQDLARQIHQFLARMPAPETERMQIQKQLRQHLQQQKDYDNANSERTI